MSCIEFDVKKCFKNGAWKQIEENVEFVYVLCN